MLNNKNYFQAIRILLGAFYQKTHPNMLDT
jgi:hypothetical protein